MKTTHKQNGITLIALVITIIILLILAGISISALTNQGLFGRANDAKKESEIASAQEKVKLALSEIITDYYIDKNKGNIDETTSLQEYIVAKLPSKIGGEYTIAIDGENNLIVTKNGQSITTGKITENGSVEFAENSESLPTVYTITYNANGATGSMAAEQKTKGTQYTIANNQFTTPSGSSGFVEWNTKEDGTGTKYAIGDNVVVNSNITLYAMWEYPVYENWKSFTIGGEDFYLYQPDSRFNSTVSLISKYCLNTAGTAQSNVTRSSYACAFSTDNYWDSALAKDGNRARIPMNLTHPEGSAISKASKYALGKGAISGRLPCYSDIYVWINNEDGTMKTPVDAKTRKVLTGQDSVDGLLQYWTDETYYSTYNSDWGVAGMRGTNLDEEDITMWNMVQQSWDKVTRNDYWGVRPVLEFKKIDLPNN